MKLVIYGLIFAGVMFGLAIGAHSLLVTTSAGDGAWAERAASVCATCHGG
ncbi:hypothetical protein [Aestuariivita boseongensis]|nr:hypothetical protein [Aestuariivita boseongensis]